MNISTLSLYKTYINITILFISILSLNACHYDDLSKPKSNLDNSIPAGIQIEYQVIRQSSYDDYGSTTQSKPYQKVIDNDHSFQQEFSKFSNSIVPNIDFSKQRVVMDSLGLLYSGSATTKVQQVYDDGELIHVIFLHTTIAENCPVTTALNRPHIFISIENIKPIKIHTKSTTKTCD